MKIDRADFLSRYGISSGELNASGLDWDELCAIADDHRAREEELLPVSQRISTLLHAVPEVHSIRVRIKHPEHVVEKLVRKCVERRHSGEAFGPVTVATYRDLIWDLVGVRVLHLFKADWLPIDDVIRERFEQLEPPLCNVRRGDPEAVVAQVRERGCEVREHPFGYRSVHYAVRDEEGYVAEIQVRTLFEEGWAEIDHRVRYGQGSQSPVLAQYLRLFNRLAGTADEMGTYMRFLQRDVERTQQALADLQRQLDGLELEREQRQAIAARVSQVHENLFDWSVLPATPFDVVEGVEGGLEESPSGERALARRPTLPFGAHRDRDGADGGGGGERGGT
ncbi:MAG: hypothetical protein KC503_05090 [Myxococcales bacterium]|nr:hypothetical protein [Myxococcales bacterium]